MTKKKLWTFFCFSYSRWPFDLCPIFFQPISPLFEQQQQKEKNSRTATVSNNLFETKNHLQLYIPSFMLVIVSWVSFWLDKDSVPARVTLGMTLIIWSLKKLFFFSTLPVQIIYSKLHKVLLKKNRFFHNQFVRSLL